MKNLRMLLFLILSLNMAAPDTCQAQILKGFGKKVENKLKKKVEEKADRHVDKTINTADRKSDESIEKTVKGDKNKKKAEKTKTTSKEQEKSKATADVPVRKDQAIRISNASSCNDFIWFKKGSQLHYEQKASTGTMQTSMKVRNVTQQQGKTISEIQVNQNLNEEDYTLNLHYICDSDTFYLDMSAMYEQIKKQMQGMGLDDSSSEVQEAVNAAELNVSEGFTSIPKHLYQGMILPDASFEFSTQAAGMNMTIHSEATDRVVEAKEQITTPAGSFETMKIRSNNTVKMEMMGRVMSNATSIDYVWIAPEVGMVKQELYTDGKLEFSSVLTEIKP